MTEKSRFWTTSGVGDGDSGGYSQDLLYELFNKTFLKDNTLEGVLDDIANELIVSGASTPLAVNTGAAWIRGFFYENTASVDIVISTPAATTGGHIVLQASWAAQTVRVVDVQSSSGVTDPPAVVQSDGVTWEIRLATYSITSGGAITLTDAREYCHFNTKVSSGMIDADAVIAGKIADGAVDVAAALATDVVETAKIKNLNVTSGKLAANSVIAGKIASGAVNAAAILASNVVETAKIKDLNVTSGKLASNAVIAGKIADGAVDVAAALANDIVNETKIGTKVLALIKRFGGDQFDWMDHGTAGYTPDNVRMQCGSFQCSAMGVVTINFSPDFAYDPIILVSHTSQGGGSVGYQLSYTTFNSWNEGFRYADVSNAIRNVQWIAIGTE